MTELCNAVGWGGHVPDCSRWIMIMQGRSNWFDPVGSRTQISVRKLARAASAYKTVLYKRSRTTGNAKMTTAIAHPMLYGKYTVDQTSMARLMIKYEEQYK